MSRGAGLWRTCRDQSVKDPLPFCLNQWCLCTASGHGAAGTSSPTRLNRESPTIIVNEQPKPFIHRSGRCRSLKLGPSRQTRDLAHWRTNARPATRSDADRARGATSDSRDSMNPVPAALHINVCLSSCGGFRGDGGDIGYFRHGRPAGAAIKQTACREFPGS